MRMRTVATLWLACIYFALSGFFTWAFYVRYWRWRDCIAAAKSSCYNPDGTEQAYTAGGMFWSIPAVVFLLLASWQVRRVMRGVNQEMGPRE